MTDFTVADAVTRLDPPISARSLRALIAVTELASTGVTQRRGRPAHTYDSADLDALHAAWVDGRISTRRPSTAR